MSLTKASYSMINGAPVNVRDFGATGDGVTDDTAAIQAAVNSGAWDVYAPAGNYLLSASIEIKTPIYFHGAGRNGTIFKQNTNFDVFVIDDGVGVMSGMSMAKFQIINTQAAASVTSGAGIRMYRSYYGVFDDILISNCYFGVRSRQSNVTRYNAVDVFFVYVGYLFSEGFSFDSYIANCVISGQGGGFSSVYMLDMCDELTFYSVIMNRSAYNVYADASAYGVNLRPEFCRFTSCSFDSSSTGVFLRHTTDMSFTNCFFSNRPGNGIQIGTTSTVENTVFQGCTFFNNGGSGAVVGQYADNTIFDNCNFVGNSTTVSNAGNGITVSANALNFTITNSVFKNGWGSSGSQNYGIAIGSGSSNGFVITNNNFGASGTGSILNQASGTNIHIANNIGFVSKNSGEATILTGNSSVVVTHGLGGQPLSKDITLTPALLPTVAVYVSALAPTTFTISAAAPVAVDTRINWIATIAGN